MGAEYSGRLAIGYTVDEFNTIVEKAGVDEGMSYYDKAEAVGLRKFSPYYDADYDDCIYGRSIAGGDTYSATTVDIEQLDNVRKMAAEMVEEFGIKPDIYIMAEGY